MLTYPSPPQSCCSADHRCHIRARLSHAAVQVTAVVSESASILLLSQKVYHNAPQWSTSPKLCHNSPQWSTPLKLYHNAPWSTSLKMITTRLSGRLFARFHISSLDLTKHENQTLESAPCPVLILDCKPFSPAVPFPVCIGFGHEIETIYGSTKRF